MVDFIIAAVLLIVVGAAIVSIIRAKKSGVKCIGCPEGGNCAHKDGGASDCGCGCGDGCRSECGCHADTKK